jgi:hypothetical protein
LIDFRNSRLTKLVAMLAVTAACACTSSTVIRSNPPGARVFIDNEPMGVTPYVMSDTKIVGSTTLVRLEAPGFQPLSTAISRNEQFDVMACIGGIVLVPLLWIEGYKPDHMYELQPAGGQPPPGHGQPQPAQAYPPPQGYPPPAGGGYPQQ